MRLLRWFVWTVLVGLLPFLIRWTVGTLLPKPPGFWWDGSADWVAFSLALCISSLQELHHHPRIGPSSALGMIVTGSSVTVFTLVGVLQGMILTLEPSVLDKEVAYRTACLLAGITFVVNFTFQFLMSRQDRRP